MPLARLTQPTERGLGEETGALLEELGQHITAYKAEAAKAAETFRKIGLVLLEGDEISAHLLEVLARHESAVMQLIDTAVEAEDRLYARADAARSRVEKEASPLAVSAEEVTTE